MLDALAVRLLAIDQRTDFLDGQIEASKERNLLRQRALSRRVKTLAAAGAQRLQQPDSLIKSQSALTDPGRLGKRRDRDHTDSIGRQIPTERPRRARAVRGRSFVAGFTPASRTPTAAGDPRWPLRPVCGEDALARRDRHLETFTISPSRLSVTTIWQDSLDEAGA